MNVGRHLGQNHPLFVIKDVTLWRNLMSVVHVAKPLAIVNPLLFIRECILGKNHMNVRTVEKPLARLDTLINIEEFILERGLMNIRSVAISSDKVHTLLIIRKFMPQSRLRHPALPHPLCHQGLWIYLLNIFGIHPLSSLIALAQNTFLSPGLFQLCKNWFPSSSCPFQVHFSHCCHSGV